MRVILVPVSDTPESKVALQASFQLADTLSADVVGCHIRSRRSSERQKPGINVPFLADLGADWDAVVPRKNPEAKRKGAERLFSKMSEDYGLTVSKRNRAAGRSAVWTERVGSPDKVMSIIGPVSDLVVVSRPAAGGGHIARIFLLSALLHSQRPILVLPQSMNRRIGRRIAIAWNQSGDASRAIAAALPILTHAEEVTIIHPSNETRVGPTSLQLRRYLARWGIASDRLTLKRGDETRSILQAYRDSRSDLLVMGAYSRSRFRELVFGGVTDYMLQKARMPVFTLHS